MIEQNNRFHAGFAAILSFVFNGLGQIYNGQIPKGLTIIFLSSVAMLILIFSSILIAFFLLGKIISLKLLILGLALFLVGVVAICILGAYSIFDAYEVAAKK